MLKPAFNGNELRGAPGRVTAQRDDILHALGVQSLQNTVNLFLGLANTRQVGHYLHASLTFGLEGDFFSESASGTAGTVGH